MSHPLTQRLTIAHWSILPSLKAVDMYSLTPKQDSDQMTDSPDLMGIEVKMRRRNSFGSTASGSQAGASRRYPPREVGPRYYNYPAPPHPRPNQPQFIPNPEYVHRTNYEAQHDYYPQYAPAPRSVNGYPIEKSHKAALNENPMKSAYPKRFSHLSMGEENAQVYHHHHLQPQPSLTKVALSSRGENLHGSEDVKEIPVWSPYSIAPLQPGASSHHHH